MASLLRSSMSAVLAVLVSGQAFDEEEARRFASLSSVTYCDPVKNVLEWNCVACAESKTRLVPGRIQIVDAGTDNATRILIGKLRDQDGCVMSFRGSDNLENWIRDVQFWEIKPSTFEECDGCEVHSGFYHIWKNVRDLATNSLRNVGCTPGDGKDNLIYVTGHSLGAALTHMAMFTLANAGFNVAKTYSFEAPRVGNRAFSNSFMERFTRKFPVFRVTHNQDPVPHLPPRLISYTHVQTEVYYNSTGLDRVCPLLEDPSCADRHTDLPSMVLLHSGDHCHTPLVPNGDICNPNCAPNEHLLV